MAEKKDKLSGKLDQCSASSAKENLARSGTSSEQKSEVEVGLLSSGGTDSKVATPDRFGRKEEFLEKNKGVSLLDKHQGVVRDILGEEG